MGILDFFCWLINEQELIICLYKTGSCFMSQVSGQFFKYKNRKPHISLYLHVIHFLF